jgi:hypothetical protein
MNRHMADCPVSEVFFEPQRRKEHGDLRREIVKKYRNLR